MKKRPGVRDGKRASFTGSEKNPHSRTRESMIRKDQNDRAEWKAPAPKHKIPLRYCMYCKKSFRTPGDTCPDCGEELGI